LATLHIRFWFWFFSCLISQRDIANSLPKGYKQAKTDGKETKKHTSKRSRLEENGGGGRKLMSRL
jgi:hypothetical protein